MASPSITLDEAACLDALKAFVAACVPEVATVDVYRARPSAVPGKWGLSVVLTPTTPLPVFQSPMGEESTGTQRQRVRVAVRTAAAGVWSVALLGVSAPGYAAGPGDSAASIRDGLRAAVDTIGAPASTLQAPAVAGAPAFDVLADVAGASMGLVFSVPVGGTGVVQVIDDNLRTASYNWGSWTIRVVVRDVSTAGSTGETSRVGPYVEMLRLRMQAQSVAVVPGSAYPYERDRLQQANLCWRRTLGPFDASVVEGGVWHRGAAIDFVFDVSSALLFDVPSLDAVVVTSPTLAEE